MHSAASEDSDVVSQAIIGSNVVTLEVRGNWARVGTADQYTGWMLGDALRKLGESGIYGRSGQVVQVEGLFANLYGETDVTLHKPVVTVPFETRLEVVAEGKGNNAGWLQVRLPDQRIAWIQSGDINRDPQPLTIAQSIALAKRFLGLPYLWGGRSSYGYDCSGFTQMLVRSRGITMPRDADLQAAWGELRLSIVRICGPGTCSSLARGPARSLTPPCISGEENSSPRPPTTIRWCRSAGWMTNLGHEFWSRAGGSNESARVDQNHRNTWRRVHGCESRIIASARCRVSGGLQVGAQRHAAQSSPYLDDDYVV